MADEFVSDKARSNVNEYNSALNDLAQCFKNTLEKLGHFVTCTKKIKQMSEQYIGSFSSYEYIFKVDEKNEFEIIPVNSNGKILIKGVKVSIDASHFIKGGSTSESAFSENEKMIVRPIYKTIDEDGWYCLAKNCKMQPIKIEENILEDLLKELFAI